MRTRLARPFLVGDRPIEKWWVGNFHFFFSRPLLIQEFFFPFRFAPLPSLLFSCFLPSLFYCRRSLASLGSGFKNVTSLSLCVLTSGEICSLSDFWQVKHSLALPKVASYLGSVHLLRPCETIG